MKLFLQLYLIMYPEEEQTSLCGITIAIRMLTSYIIYTSMMTGVFYRFLIFFLYDLLALDPDLVPRRLDHYTANRNKKNGLCVQSKHLKPT